MFRMLLIAIAASVALGAAVPVQAAKCTRGCGSVNSDEPNGVTLSGTMVAIELPAVVEAR